MRVNITLEHKESG